MPWCQNEGCDKKNLRKDDVVFDDEHKRVLCIPCGQKVARDGTDLAAEVYDKTWFGVGYSSDEGLTAEVVYGGAKLSVNVDNAQIMRLFGR